MLISVVQAYFKQAYNSCEMMPLMDTLRDLVESNAWEAGTIRLPSGLDASLFQPVEADFFIYFFCLFTILDLKTTSHSAVLEHACGG